MRQFQIYLRRVFLLPPSLVLTEIHSILAYDVPGTKDVDLPTECRFNVGPALQDKISFISSRKKVKI